MTLFRLFSSSLLQASHFFANSIARVAQRPQQPSIRRLRILTRIDLCKKACQQRTQKENKISQEPLLNTSLSPKNSP